MRTPAPGSKTILQQLPQWAQHLGLGGWPLQDGEGIWPPGEEIVTCSLLFTRLPLLVLMFADSLALLIMAVWQSSDLRNNSGANH